MPAVDVHGALVEKAPCTTNILSNNLSAHEQSEGRPQRDAGGHVQRAGSGKHTLSVPCACATVATQWLLALAPFNPPIIVVRGLDSISSHANATACMPGLRPRPDVYDVGQRPTSRQHRRGGGNKHSSGRLAGAHHFLFSLLCVWHVHRAGDCVWSLVARSIYNRD